MNKNMWDAINCRLDCGRCNHKGKPSNSKGSKDCIILRKEVPIQIKDDAFSFRMFFKQLVAKKGIMRATGKYNQEEKKVGKDKVESYE